MCQIFNLKEILQGLELPAFVAAPTLARICNPCPTPNIKPNPQSKLDFSAYANHNQKLKYIHKV